MHLRCKECAVCDYKFIKPKVFTQRPVSVVLVIIGPSLFWGVFFTVLQFLTQGIHWLNDKVSLHKVCVLNIFLLRPFNMRETSYTVFGQRYSLG